MPLAKLIPRMLRLVEVKVREYFASHLCAHIIIHPLKDRCSKGESGTQTHTNSYLGQSNGQLSYSTGIQRGTLGTDQKELVVEWVLWLEIENCHHRHHRHRLPYLGASYS